MTVTWNSGDKTANITLSGGSLTAQLTSASYGGVRATSSVSTGKIYFELYLVAGLSSNVAIGWANSTASMTTYIGQDQNSWAYFYYTSGNNVWKNNASIFSTGVAASLSQYLCIAFDVDNLKGWVRINNGYWNNSSTADPATGSGSFSLAGMNSGPYFPIFNSNVNGATVTANFGASDFNYAIPSGFTALDTNVQAFNASAKFLGYDITSPPQTAVSSSKYLGYDLLSPPQNAASTAKFVAYAVLQPLTATPYSMGFVYG